MKVLSDFRRSGLQDIRIDKYYRCHHVKAEQLKPKADTDGFPTHRKGRLDLIPILNGELGEYTRAVRSILIGDNHCRVSTTLQVRMRGVQSWYE